MRVPQTLPALHKGERLDDLQYKGLCIIQNPEHFCFGTDAVLLADFARVKRGDVVVDLGTGSGVILLLLSTRTQAERLTGVEIQSDVADMARRSVTLNALETKVDILCLDLIEAPERLGLGSADCVVCNPPYGKAGTGKHSENDVLRIARHEVCCTLADCVRSASRLAKSGGRVYFVHQSERLFELAAAMQAHHVEPKRIRLIQSSADKAPHLVLVEGIKLGKSGAHFLPTLLLYDENGSETEELRRIYHKEQDM